MEVRQTSIVEACRYLLCHGMSTSGSCGSIPLGCYCIHFAQELDLIAGSTLPYPFVEHLYLPLFCLNSVIEFPVFPPRLTVVHTLESNLMPYVSVFALN